MRQSEVTVLIRAWLEDRDVPGLERAFRARLSLPALDRGVGVSSVAELHRELDRFLAELDPDDLGGGDAG